MPTFTTPQNPEKPDQEDTSKISPEEIEEIYDIWEDYEEGLEKKRGGGGGKTKKHGAKTTKAIEDSQLRNSKEKQMADTKKALVADLARFPVTENHIENQKRIGRYVSWINSYIHEEDLSGLAYNELGLGNISLDVRSKSSGPGGQNVNKLAVTAFYKHLVTGISAESTISRQLQINKDDAMAKLNEKLRKHILNWRKMTDGDALTPEVFSNLLELN